jgi:Transposase IS116/IS110/IS902 family
MEILVYAEAAAGAPGIRGKQDGGSGRGDRGRMRPFEAEVERLDTIPGVDRVTAWTLIAEMGVKMEQFPSAAHFSSWARLCPGSFERAGKRLSGKTRKGVLRFGAVSLRWARWPPTRGTIICPPSIDGWRPDEAASERSRRSLTRFWSWPITSSSDSRTIKSWERTTRPLERRCRPSIPGESLGEAWPPGHSRATSPTGVSAFPNEWCRFSIDD